MGWFGFVLFNTQKMFSSRLFRWTADYRTKEGVQRRHHSLKVEFPYDLYMFNINVDRNSKQERSEKLLP